MSPNALARTLFGVLGVYLIVTRLSDVLQLGVFQGLGLGSELGSPPDARASGAYLVLAVITVVAGLSLVLLRGVLAERLAPEMGGGTSAGPQLTAPELLAVGLAVAGAYLLISGLGLAGHELVLWRDDGQWLLWSRARFLNASVHVVGGLALLVGSRPIARLWSWARGAGLPAT